MVDMQDSLKLLQTRVLPEIQNNPAAANVEHFLAIDLEENRMPPHSLADAFNVNFRSDYIRVSRYSNEQYFRVDNGLHRIQAARDLGWNAVPGKVVEVPPPEDRNE